MFFKALVSIVALFFFAAFALLPASGEVFTDDFGKRLDVNVWHFNSSGDAKSTTKVKDGMLEMHIDGLHEMGKDVDKGLKLLLRRVPPQADWTMDVCMQFDKAPFWQWSGLIVYDPTNDPSTNWISLLYGHTLTKLMLLWLEDDELHELSCPFVPGNTTCLRIVREGNKYNFFTKAVDAADDAWAISAELAPPDTIIAVPNPSQLGVLVYSFMNHESSDTLFDSFSLSGEDIILEEMQSVTVGGKLSATWGMIKRTY